MIQGYKELALWPQFRIALNGMLGPEHQWNQLRPLLRLHFSSASPFIQSCFHYTLTGPVLKSSHSKLPAHKFPCLQSMFPKEPNCGQKAYGQITFTLFYFFRDISEWKLHMLCNQRLEFIRYPFREVISSV